VAVPARRTQLAEHRRGVVATLSGDDDVAALERVDVVRVLQRGLVLRLRRSLAARVRGREEQRLEVREVIFSLHAIHQDRADHAAPADQTYECHFRDSLLSVVPDP